jgi:hypothetical protein
LPTLVLPRALHRVGVDQPVPVRRPAAKMPTLGADLGCHRGSGSPAGTQYLPFGLVTRWVEHRLVGGVGQVDPPIQFGEPDADAVGVELSDDAVCLAGGEGAFELADHHRVERPIGVGGGAQQRGGLWAMVPKRCAGVADVEVLDQDSATAVDHAGRVVALPFL